MAWSNDQTRYTAATTTPTVGAAATGAATAAAAEGGGGDGGGGAGNGDIEAVLKGQEGRLDALNSLFTPALCEEADVATASPIISTDPKSLSTVAGGVVVLHGVAAAMHWKVTVGQGLGGGVGGGMGQGLGGMGGVGCPDVVVYDGLNQEQLFIYVGMTAFEQG